MLSRCIHGGSIGPNRRTASSATGGLITSGARRPYRRIALDGQPLVLAAGSDPENELLSRGRVWVRCRDAASPSIQPHKAELLPSRRQAGELFEERHGSTLLVRAFKLRAIAPPAFVRATADHLRGRITRPKGSLPHARLRLRHLSQGLGEVKRYADRDVLSVKASGPSAEARYTVVLAVDGSAESMAAVRSLASKMQTIRADIHLLHVAEHPAVSLEDVIGAARASLQREGLSSTFEVPRGKPASEIPACARERDARVIAVGTRGIGPCRAPSWGA